MAELNEKTTTAAATEHVDGNAIQAVSTDRTYPEIESIDANSTKQSEHHRASWVSKKTISTIDSESIGPDRPINIDNPLAILTPHQLEQKLSNFLDMASDLKGSQTLLRRGANLVRDKDAALEDDDALSPEQKDYLKDLDDGHRELEYPRPREESSGLGKQSKFLKASLITTCLAGIDQGWTQSVINGVNIGMPIDLGLHYRPDDPLRNTADRWTVSLLSAIVFLASGLIVPFFSDPLQDYWFGRRGAIAIACIISIAAIIGQACSHTVGQLLGCRLLTGIALAARASAAPLLVAETAPNHLRGKLLSAWQLSDACGIFLGFASNLAVLHIKASSRIIWRIETITVLIPTTALLIVVFFPPESPRYLMKRGKYAKALESFTYLRPKPVASLLAARDLVSAHFQLEAEDQFMKAQRNNNAQLTSRDIASRLRDSMVEEAEPPIEKANCKASYHISKTKPHQRLGQTLKDPRSRRALVCASTAMVAQQLSGINTIVFLSASLLRDHGATEQQGAWVGFGIGLCNFIFGYPAWLYFDKIGRATLLLLGFPPMFILLLITALLFQIPEKNVRLVLVSIFGILYVMAYAPTAGPAPFAISAEVFSLVTREMGHSLAVGVNFVSLGIVLLIFPSLSDAMGGLTASLALFAALNIVAFVLCFLFVPETKRRTIEELQYTFDLPTRKHIQYRCRIVAPWFLKKYIMGPVAVKLGIWKKAQLDYQVGGGLPPFHRWARNA